MDNKRYTKYRATRAHNPKLTAREILSRIRDCSKIATEFMPAAPYNPEIEGTKERWIENTDRAGLRFVNFADEIIRLDNNGWFNHYDQGAAETFRGAVWQLPAIKGSPVYVYGYCDPNNDGAALINFDTTHGDPGGTEETGNCESLRDAARWADHTAEKHAEREREYQMKADAEIKADELIDEVREIGKTLGKTISQGRARMKELRNEARELVDEPWTIAHGF